MSGEREAVRDALMHRQPAAVPMDINGTLVTGMHASCVEALRTWYGLPDRPVRMYDVFLGLGYMETDLLEAMGVGVQAPMPVADNFGNRFSPLDGWKEMSMPWGQTVLVPGQFVYAVADNGDYLGYPSGDGNARPSARMPKSGYFFDALIRQEEIDDDALNPDDNIREYGPISDADLDFLAEQAVVLAGTANGRARIGSLPGAGLGDICHIPGVSLANPKGIRDVEEWYVSMAGRVEYVREVFARQTEIALENMRRIHSRIGDDAYDVVIVCGADFGTQTGQFCSAESLRGLQMPFYQKMNGWIHDNTPWKTMKHTCGAVMPLLGALIESGFDILNPVQCSAAGMDPADLKNRYGDRLTFWGGGVDTQKTLPFGTPEEVRREVLERCRVFSRGGGFVFAAIHNIQAGTPVKNIVAMIDAVHEFNGE